VIPTLHHNRTPVEHIGVVGTLSSPLRARVEATAASVGVKAHFVALDSSSAVAPALNDGRITMAIVDDASIAIKTPLAATDVSANAQFIRATAVTLGVARAQASAGLTPSQVATLASATPLSITAVHRTKTSRGPDPTSLVGVILIFMMLSQYLGWILVGVMEEKSSRVVEVLLATVRPIQVIMGKVIGIGTVAFAQAGLIVAFALILAKAVGSSLIHGSAPWVIASVLVWLVLGYAFYCWIYAAAGSTVERQDQAQTLAFPLTLPLLFGYIISLTTASSGSASAFFKVLAYVPLTAPFAMPTLVGLGEVAWWQFALSVAIDLVCTVLVARFAANIYRRAILRTGTRVKLRELRARHH
jgi:ABC-2 type transport system permease protein